MNITLEKIDAVNGLITVEIEKADYADRVSAALKDFRKKANMPGFRPGQAPMGMLKKRFGEEITVEQVNKLLGEKLYGYIREEKLNILGEPLPNEEKQMDIDFNTMKKFSFVFDIAFAPEFDAKIADTDEIAYYDINVDDDMVEKQVQMYTNRAGSYQKVDDYQEKDMVKGLIAELDADGNTLEGGVQAEGAVMLPNYMKDDAEKAKFEGAKVGDVIVFNPNTAYAGSEVELASLLKVDKEVAAEKKGDFSFQVQEITRFAPAEINQALFDQILGEGVVKSEEEFRAAIRKTMEEQFATDSDFKFMVDLRSYLTTRVGELTYPTETLKRIMRLNNKDKDEKFVEDNFEKSLKELTWHLIKEQLSDQLEVKIEQSDVLETAKQITRVQFAQYGMANVPDEVLANYASEMLKDQRQAEGIVERSVENKIAAAAKNLVKLNHKSVSIDEFNKMFSEAE